MDIQENIITAIVVGMAIGMILMVVVLYYMAQHKHLYGEPSGSPTDWMVVCTIFALAMIISAVAGDFFGALWVIMVIVLILIGIIFQLRKRIDKKIPPED